MTDTPNFNTKVYVVPANGTRPIDTVGDFVMNMTTSTAAGSLTLKIGEAGKDVRFDASDKYKMPPGQTFNSCTLTNTTGGDITVTVGIGQGDFNVASAVTVSNTVTTTVTPGATMLDAADTTVNATTTTKVITGTANNKTVIISNLVANATKIRVGTSSAGAARGVEVANGGSISLDTQADVYVYNPSAGAINIGTLILKV